MRERVIFSVTDIVEVIKARQGNEFDANIGIGGDRGDGKSTLAGKILYKHGKFKPWKHQVYSQKDVIHLLTTERYGKCFDDEAINTGYKRDFQDKGQKKLIKILTNYRDNFNVYLAALPNFFSLDKDLRDMIFMFIHVIERGVAVVHLPIQGRMYTQDRWDAKNNAKIEQRWQNKIKESINFKIPYHTLSTFAGYLYFTDMTPKQRDLYKEVKRTKRALEYEQEDNGGSEEKFIEKVYRLVIEKKLDQQRLRDLCLLEDKKYSNVNSSINTMLKDRNAGGTLKEFLLEDRLKKGTNDQGGIKDLVPSFSA